MPRVFLSYTARDLAAHASVAKQAAVEAGWEVVDHRDWAPNGRPSVSECMKHVDACDALIVLSGAHYGWVPAREEGGEETRSITWLEVLRARSRGIAVIPLLLNDAEFQTVAEGGSPEQVTGEKLAAFRAELRQSLVRFFGADPNSAAASVRQGLEAWDGRANDERMPWRRRLRQAAPLLLVLCLVAAWMLAGPAIHGRLLSTPQLSLAAWLRFWGTVVVWTGAAVVIGLWVFWAGRGRPQTRYRLFPLSRRGDVVLTLMVAVAFAVAGSGVVVRTLQRDSELEALLASYLDGARVSRTSPLLSPERWANARHEGDVRALRDFVIPVEEARRNLSRRLALSEVRESLRKLTVPMDMTDPHVILLVAIARFHTIAISQDAKRAISYYQTDIQPTLPSRSPVWRAEALYAFAGWTDFWAFTNLIETLDRTGAPKYTEAQVAEAFDKVLAEVEPLTGRPSWVACAAKTTASMSRSRTCVNKADGLCATVDPMMRAAIACHESREDAASAREPKRNLALRHLAAEKYHEAYDYLRNSFDETGSVQDGLHAIGIELLSRVAPAGQMLNSELIAKEIGKEADRRQQNEQRACLDILERTRAGVDVQGAPTCRIAFACFLTDNPAANLKFCGVPDIPLAGAATLLGDSKPVAVEKIPAQLMMRGAVKPSIPAKDVVAECDGDVEMKPSFVVDLPKPARLILRVYSQGDSVVLMRGPKVSACGDDSPMPGQLRSRDAGLLLDAEAGRHEFYVGTFGHESLSYEARLTLRPQRP